MAKADLTAARLRELLDYDPETGIFTWVKSPKAGIPAGSIAGAKEKKGYWQIKIAQRVYAAHRLALLYVTGEWPVGQVDHKNGDRRDNRYVNLRDVTTQVNRQNMRVALPTSTTGYLGVSTEGNRWRARICVDGKQTVVGYYDSPQDAHQAYLVAKRRLHSGCTI